MVFLDPLFRLLEKCNVGYHFQIPTITCNSTIYVDNLAIIMENISHIQTQIANLQKPLEWAHLDLNMAKWAITCNPTNSI